MRSSIALCLAFASMSAATDLAGVVIRFEKPTNDATLTAELIEKFILPVQVGRLGSSSHPESRAAEQRKQQLASE